MRPTRRPTLAVVLLATALFAPQSARAAGQVVISQVYGGGGNSGATYTNDFIELFNRGDATVDLSSYSVQYTSAAGTTWQATNLSGSIAPGHYYLVQEAAGAGGTTPLPTPNATGSIAMGATGGKAAVVSSTTLLSGGCPTGGAIVDFVGVGGSATCYEGTGPTAASSNTLAVLRAGGGCTDTNVNSADFATGAPTPRNSSSSTTSCSSSAAIVPTCPSPLATGIGVPASVGVSATDPDGIVTSASITNITPTPAAGSIALSAFVAAAASGGTATATLGVDASVPGGSYSVTVTWSNSDTPVAQTATCTVTVQVGQPVVPVCPAALSGPTGTAASAPVSASDVDGIVTGAVLVVTPTDPGTITLTGFSAAAAAGGTASATLNLGSTTPAGSYTATITWSNNDASPQTATCAVTVTAYSHTPIHTIQGNGSTSPLAGSTVTTRGIVTGFKSGSSGGYYIQEPDASVDADPSTSEGIFVFTGGTFPAAAVRGNLVLVTGSVSDYIPSVDPGSPPLTEISPTAITLLSTGNTLPAPIVLAAADLPANGTLENLEKYEGMRVQVNSLTVISPTAGNVDEANATSTSTGVFYGVITGTGRPFREPGVIVGDTLPTGAPATVTRFDGNPEKLRVDSDGQPGGTAIEVSTGAVVTNLVGPLDFAFRTYTILPDPPPATAPGVTPGISPTAVPTPAANQLTIASFNMERFFDTTNDAGVSDAVLTATAFANRLSKASLAIRNYLMTPDVIGVQEVENLTTLQAIATKVNNDAVAASQPNPVYVAYLVEGNDVGGIDVGYLVKSSRVTVVDVTQLNKTETWVDPDDSTSKLLNDRPPLVLRATVTLAGGPFPFTVVNNHLRSLSDIENVTLQHTRAKREAQAESLAAICQARQGENLVVLGDMNSFEFSDGYVDVMGALMGTPVPAAEVVLASPANLTNPHLVNLDPTAIATERYSYTFDGAAQALDHVLVNAAMVSATASRKLEHARVDADFPESLRGNASSPARLSDHDPAVAFFTISGLPVELTTFDIE